MGNDVVDIADCDARFFRHTGDVIHESTDSKLEGFLPFHEDHGFFFFDLRERRGSAERGDFDDAVPAHGTDFRAEIRIAGFEYRRACAVTENDSRAAILPVDNFTDAFRTDDKSTLCGSACEESRRRFHGKQESAASGAYVKRRAGGTETCLDHPRRGRADPVGRDGRDDNQIDGIRGNAAHFECLCRSLICKVGGAFRGRNPAFCNTDAGTDPFVVRLHHSGQIIVGDNF